jgi:hypothetical protein
VKLKTIDIPQADSLALVRGLLEVVARSEGAAVKDLATGTGFSERHVRYRTQAARILGLIDEATALTPRGRRLLATEAGSPAEKRELRRAVAECSVIQQVAPDLLSASGVDVKTLARKICALSGLSASTAERRAVVLRAWHRDLN